MGLNICNWCLVYFLTLVLLLNVPTTRAETSTQAVCKLNIASGKNVTAKVPDSLSATCDSNGNMAISLSTLKNTSFKMNVFENTVKRCNNLTCSKTDTYITISNCSMGTPVLIELDLDMNGTIIYGGKDVKYYELKCPAIYNATVIYTFKPSIITPNWVSLPVTVIPPTVKMIITETDDTSKVALKAVLGDKMLLNIQTEMSYLIKPIKCFAFDTQTKGSEQQIKLLWTENHGSADSAIMEQNWTYDGNTLNGRGRNASIAFYAFLFTGSSKWDITFECYIRLCHRTASGDETRECDKDHTTGSKQRRSAFLNEKVMKTNARLIVYDTNNAVNGFQRCTAKAVTALLPLLWMYNVF